MHDDFDPAPRPQMAPMPEVPVLKPIHVEDDHEVKMAQAQVYRAAKNALELHKMLKFVDELEGWTQAKITLAAENLENVKNYLEYEMVSATLAEGQKPRKLMEDYKIPAAKIGAFRKLGQKMNDAISAGQIDDDELYNKFASIGNKLVHLAAPGQKEYATFEEPTISSEDIPFVNQAIKMFGMSKAKSAAQHDWADFEKWPHKMAEAEKIMGVPEHDARIGQWTGILKDHWRAMSPQQRAQIVQQRPNWHEEIGTAAHVLALLGLNPQSARLEETVNAKKKVIKEGPHHLGKLIASKNGYKLYHHQDRYDAHTVKNEYEVYKGAEFKKNLDMPYRDKDEAVKAFNKWVALES